MPQGIEVPSGPQPDLDHGQRKSSERMHNSTRLTPYDCYAQRKVAQNGPTRGRDQLKMPTEI
jgi:hypothetical protein